MKPRQSDTMSWGFVLSILVVCRALSGLEMAAGDDVAATTTDWTYWDRLRIPPPDNNNDDEFPLLESATFAGANSSRVSSNVARVTTASGETFRLVHLTAFLAFEGGTRLPAYDEAAAIVWAAGNWNAGVHEDEAAALGLPQCDVRFTVELFDTGGDRVQGTDTLKRILERPNHNLREPLPAVVVGAFRSSVSAPMTIVNQARDIPQVSGASSSAYFDDAEIYPLFARTVLSSVGEARALVQFYLDLGVDQFAVLHISDAFGVALRTAIQDFAITVGVEVVTVAYESHKPEKLEETAIQPLIDSQLHHILHIGLTPEDHVAIMRVAHRRGIVNGKHAWLLYGFDDAVLQDMAVFPFGSDLYEATSGLGLFTLGAFSRRSIQFPGERSDEPLPPIPSTANERLRAGWRGPDFDRDFLDHFESKLPPEIPIGTLNNPISSVYAYFMYDAVAAIAVALCLADQDFPVGREIIQQFPNVEFDGASGFVKFNQIGTRDSASVKFTLWNFLPENQVDADGRNRFILSSAFEYADGNWIKIRDFVYANGGNVPPVDLRPSSGEIEKVNIGLKVCGLILCFVTAVFCCYCVIWTFVHRNQSVVCAAQPSFLYLIAVGSLLQSTAIIPLSLTDQGYDNVCMAVPWVYYTGFALSSAALYAKTWRLREVFYHKEKDHLFVSKRDLGWGVSVILGLNAIGLFLWTTLMPLEYKLISDGSIDEFGRPLSSYGVCRGSDGGFPRFLIGLILGNLGLVVIAIWWSFRGRQIEAEYSETQFTGFALGVIFESLAIGGPMQYVTRDSVDGLYAIGLAMVLLTSLAVGGLVFIPKMLTFRLEKEALAEYRRSQFDREDAPRFPVTRDETTLAADESDGHDPVGAPNSQHSLISANLTELGLRIFSHPANETQTQPSTRTRSANSSRALSSSRLGRDPSSSSSGVVREQSVHDQNHRDQAILDHGGQQLSARSLMAQ